MRTNTKTVTKFYDQLTSNGWNINFEYEVENGVLVPRIVVKGTKENANVYIEKSLNQTQVIFSNGNHDVALTGIIMDEIGLIELEHAPEA